MLKLTTTGTAYERGLQQGKTCADLARPWFQSRLEEMRHKVGPVAAKQDANLWRRRLEQAYPDGYAECCGIAAGMDWSEEDYFMTTVSSRLLERVTQCTVVGFYDGESRPLFAKTDDIHRYELGMNVMEGTIPDCGYRHIHFHFACSIWTVAGMNEHGLAMGMTGIPGPLLDKEGLFSLDALHGILPVCATVDEAIAHITELRLNCGGFSLTLSDATGRLAQVEKTGVGLVSLPLLPDMVYVHANTIVDGAFASQNPPQTTELAVNSDRRIQNAKRLLATIPRTEQGLYAMYEDRNPDGAIRQSGAEGMFTDFWVLFSSKEKSFQYGAGWPDYLDTGSVSMLERDEATGGGR